MILERVSCGNNVPNDINVIIGIPSHSGPVKYEVDKLTNLYSSMNSVRDLPESLLDSIAHFFDHYKDLETGKWVEIDGWIDTEDAKREILDSIERHNNETAQYPRTSEQTLRRE